MCLYCNIYGHLTDPALAEAVGISTDDIIAPSAVHKVVLNKAAFDNSKQYWLSLMTPEERVSFEAVVRSPGMEKYEDEHGYGLDLLNNCAALSMKVLTEKSWTRLEGQELIDAGICTADSTPTKLCIDGSKEVAIGGDSLARYFPQ